MTVTIEVIRDEAFTLLSDMERLELIQINTTAKNTIPEKGRLSEQYGGALRLSDTRYEAYQNTLREGRNEWNRDTH
ncbi:MAG: hypothetical protein LBQ94_11390 [Treponema sp.]|jgi:hypothetical protein|nr:hypothetical protein [Treponema sp.]